MRCSHTIDSMVIQVHGDLTAHSRRFECFCNIRLREFGNCAESTSTTHVAFDHRSYDLIKLRGAPNMSNGVPLNPRCSGTHEAWMLYLQKKLWRVWKLRIITKTTPKPLDLTSNGVKTCITIASKLWGGCDIICRCHFCRKLAKYM